LASSLNVEGIQSKAETMFVEVFCGSAARQASSIQKQHPQPNTWQALSPTNLGKHDAVVALLREVFVVQMRVFGVEHAETLDTDEDCSDTDEDRSHMDEDRARLSHSPTTLAYTPKPRRTVR
jgi:hypothetical protein